MNSLLKDVTNMHPLCSLSDLIPNAGVCAQFDGEQVALFYLPEQEPAVFALNNYDPFSKANVLSRGIVGDLDGHLVVASPIYKQHFDLTTGQSLEDEAVGVKSYDVHLSGDTIYITP